MMRNGIWHLINTVVKEDGKYFNIKIVPLFKVLFMATEISYESCKIIGFVFNLQGLCHLIFFTSSHCIHISFLPTTM